MCSWRPVTYCSFLQATWNIAEGELYSQQKDKDEEEGLEQLVMAVIVKNGSSRSGSPKDAGIVIEALKVFTGHALSLDLCIESPVSQASFQVFQKLFLELDSSKFMNWLQYSKSKLLSDFLGVNQCNRTQTWNLSSGNVDGFL